MSHSSDKERGGNITEPDKQKPGALSALRYRDFNLHMAGRLFGNAGAQILSVGIGWQVYDLTHDPFALGMVGLCQFLPCLLLVFHAGHLADRADRARLLAGTYFLSALCGAVLLQLTWGNNAETWPIYVVSVILGIVRITGSPTSKALVLALVPPEASSSAIAYSAASFQIATIGGPALGGLAYIFGAAAVYWTAVFFLVLAGLFNILIRTRNSGGKRPLDLENMLAGLRFIIARPVMLGAISLDLFAVLFGGIVALLPIYAKDILHVGATGLGFLRGAPALGAAFMALLLARLPIRHGVGRKLFVSVAIFGLATIGFGLSQSFVLSFMLLVVLGAADMISVYVRTHLTQLQTPDAMRGRVASVSMLFVTASNELGEFESGVTASWFGTVPATILGGVMTLAVAALCAWRIPALRKIDRFEDAE